MTPEYFRLPARGVDPHFGLTRSWYYAAEARGEIRLVRLRARGKLRGVTLVPYDVIAGFIHAEANAFAQPIVAAGQSELRLFEHRRSGK